VQESFRGPLYSVEHEIFQLESIHEVAHWLMVKLVHLSSGKIFPIINVYMPNNYWEKLECWESLLGIRDSGFYHRIVL
jgi:hypothetical protein